MDPPRYRYQPLTQPDEIRVLKLGTNTTRIEVSILYVPVSTRVFHALSYVWGNPEQASEAVILDRLDNAIGWIPLTANLGNALRDLRGVKELGDALFWIDQICINQQDEQEKNVQVAMMSQIYTQAKQVITYLGPAGVTEVEERGLKLLNRIGRAVGDVWPRIHEVGSIERVREDLRDGSIQLGPLPVDLAVKSEKGLDDGEIHRRYIEQGWHWLICIAYSEWTQRLWIVQEQVLNKKITTLRGNRLIEWDAITTIPVLFAIGYLPQEYYDKGRQHLGESTVRLDEVERTIYGIWWDRHARLDFENEYSWSPLLHNLQWYQSQLCRDPRDRVYAILAISEDSADLGLKPDYSAFNTADHLSKQLTTRILTNGENLEVLSFGLSWRRPGSTLPSWCLDLQRTPGAKEPANVPVEVYTPHPRSLLVQPVQFREDHSILVVKGRILDYVAAARSPKSPHTTRDMSRISFFSSLVDTVPDDFSVEDLAGMLRAVTASGPWTPSSIGHGDENDAMVFHFWAYLRNLLRTSTEASGLPCKTARKLSEICLPILERSSQLMTHKTHIESHFSDKFNITESKAVEKMLQYTLEEGRCLGRTHKGRFFNAIYTAQEGDAIVALQGSDQLFAIRKTGSKFVLIGDIYVDGLMNGEAYEGIDAETVDYDIELA